jgi:hypothetical protein
MQGKACCKECGASATRLMTGYFQRTGGQPGFGADVPALPAVLVRRGRFDASFIIRDHARNLIYIKST